MHDMHTLTRVLALPLIGGDLPKRRLVGLLITRPRDVQLKLLVVLDNGGIYRCSSESGQAMARNWAASCRL